MLSTNNVPDKKTSIDNISEKKLDNNEPNIIQPDDIKNIVKTEKDTEKQIMSTMKFGKMEEPLRSEKIISEVTGNIPQKKIYIKYDTPTKRFNFVDNNNRYTGSLTTYDIIKYFTKIYNTDNKFLENVNNSNYELVTNFIGDINEQSHTISLKDFNTSPFMGDLEMLIKLNDNLQQFEKNELEKELNFVSEKMRERIRGIYYRFVIAIIEYTIRLISSLSDIMIGHNEKDARVRSNLILYSSKLIYRLSKYTELQLKFILEKNKKINKNMELSRKLRELVNKRLEKYTRLLEERNVVAREQQLVKNVIEQAGGSQLIIESEEESSGNNEQEEILSDTSDIADNTSSTPDSEPDHSAIYDM